MTLNQMKLGASFAECLVFTHDKGLSAVDRGSRISSKRLKRWWPGTGLNRRQLWCPSVVTVIAISAWGGGRQCRETWMLELAEESLSILN
jgi:hypothetical protein